MLPRNLLEALNLPRKPAEEITTAQRKSLRIFMMHTLPRYVKNAANRVRDSSMQSFYPERELNDDGNHWQYNKELCQELRESLAPYGHRVEYVCDSEPVVTIYFFRDPPHVQES